MMRFYKNVMALLCGCCLWGLGGLEASKISLKEAEEWALRNNDQLSADLYRIEEGYYGCRAARAHFFPNVSVAASWGFDKKSRSVDAVVRLTQPLYDQPALYQLKASQLEWERLKIELQESVCRLLFQVREAYEEVLLHEAHLRLDRMVVEIWEEEVKREGRFEALGASLVYEVHEAQFNLKRAWMEVYAAQQKIYESRLRLLTLMSLPPDTPIELEGEERPPPSEDERSVDLWLERALAFCPQLRKERFAFFLSQNQLREAKANRKPKVNLYADAGHAYTENGFDRQPSFGLGLNLNWSLYAPVNERKVRQAQAGNDGAACRYRDAELQAAAKTRRLLYELGQRRQIHEMAREGADLAAEGMQLADGKRHSGAMSAFEYRDAVKTFHKAQQEVIRARFDWQCAYDRLIEHAGMDYWECDGTCKGCQIPSNGQSHS